MTTAPFSSRKMFYFVCVGVLSTCTPMHCIHTWCPRKLSDALELELLLFVSHPVGAGLEHGSSRRASTVL